MFGKPQISPELLMALGGGIMSGQNLGQGLGQGFQNASNIMTLQRQEQQLKEGENKTRAFVQKMFPDKDFSQAPPDVLKLYATEAIKSQFSKPEKPNIMNAGNGLLYNSDTGQWIQPPADMAQSQVDAGLNLQYGVDDQGNIVPMQATKDGRLIKSQMPEGVKLSKEPMKLDAGTHYVLIDPITRQPISTIPKNIAEVQKQEEIGIAEGKSIAAAPADLQAGLNAKSLIESLKTDPNREWGTGWSGWLMNSIPATPGKDYQTKVDQAKSGAFLTAIQQLRGMGSLSNTEGDTATKAVTRMNTATSEEAFMEALTDYERIIDQGIANARAKIAANPSMSNQTQQPSTTDGMNTTTTGVPWRKK